MRTDELRASEFGKSFFGVVRKINARCVHLHPCAGAMLISMHVFTEEVVMFGT